MLFRSDEQWILKEEVTALLTQHKTASLFFDLTVEDEGNDQLFLSDSDDEQASIAWQGTWKWEQGVVTFIGSRANAEDKVKIQKLILG